MTSFSLRLLAAACAVLGHAGLVVSPRLALLRIPDQLSFPVACFLLTQGFLHTKSRRRYAVRLLAIALLAEVPYDALLFGRPFSLLEQNAAFSLLLSLGALCADERLTGRLKRAASCACFCLAGMWLRTAFGFLGPLLCLAFRLAGGSPSKRAAAAFSVPLLSGLLLMAGGMEASPVRLLLVSALAALPVFLYRDRPDPRGPALSFLFYALWPLHLAALCLLRASRIVPPWLFG